MAEVSKTARASMVQAPQEKRAEETTEEAIRQIRLERAAGIWPSTSRIDKLLVAFDRERAAVAELAPACAGLLKRAETAEAKLRAYEELSKSTELIVKHPEILTVTMKDPEFDHPHEDEHHMVDFGHHTVHPTDAGA